MKIAITGAGGFIGRHLARELQERADLSCFDLGNREELFRGRYDAILHFGAISDTRSTDLATIDELNVRYSARVFEHARRWPCIVIYASSASVYSEKRTPYAESKAQMESMAGNDFTGLRFFNVYGEDEGSKGRSASFIWKAKNASGPVELFEGTLDSARDWLPVDAAVRRTLSYLYYPRQGVFEVGSGKPKTFRALLAEIGKDYTIVQMPEELRDTYQHYTCARSST